MGEGQISSGMGGTEINLVFKPLSGIQPHHLRFTHDDPGHVYVKKHVSYTEAKRVCVLKRGVSWPPP